MEGAITYISQEPLVTVIIPAYNVQDYLERCVSSVTGQTYRRLEIIIVDDGSTDGTGRIADERARYDERIKVLHRQNGGLSAARNAALDIMTGDFVMMVDGDDIIHHQMIERLLMMTSLQAIESDGDIIIADWQRFAGSNDALIGTRAIKPPSLTAQLFLMLFRHKLSRCTAYEPRPLLRKIFYQQQRLTHSACARLYRANVFNGDTPLRYPEGMLYEDLAVIPQLLNRCRRALFVPEKLYFYRQRQGSITQHFKPERAHVLDILEKYEKDYADDDEMLPAVQSRLLSAAFNMLRLMPREEQYDDLYARSEANIRRLRRKALADSNVRFINKAVIVMTYLLGIKTTRRVLSFCG